MEQPDNGLVHFSFSEASTVKKKNEYHLHFMISILSCSSYHLVRLASHGKLPLLRPPRDHSLKNPLILALVPREEAKVQAQGCEFVTSREVRCRSHL